jgi:hypothetical protein
MFYFWMRLLQIVNNNTNKTKLVIFFAVLVEAFDITLEFLHSLWGFTPSYILHTRAFGTYLLGGGIYLAEKIIM